MIVGYGGGEGLQTPSRGAGPGQGSLFGSLQAQRDVINLGGCGGGEEDHMADRLISCDDHMDLGQLPADLCVTRLPAALRDRAPRIEERDGQAVWICDGKVWGSWGGKPPANGGCGR